MEVKYFMNNEFYLDIHLIRVKYNLNATAAYRLLNRIEIPFTIFQNRNLYPEDLLETRIKEYYNNPKK